MAMTPCLEPGCGELATYRGRCAIHSKDRERETHRTGRIEGRSGRMYKRSKWVRTSQQYRANHPLCELCLAEGKETWATEVDHIVPLEQGGEPWGEVNLQALCRPHHSRKTRREQRQGITPAA